MLERWWSKGWLIMFKMISVIIGENYKCFEISFYFGGERLIDKLL